MPCFHPLTSYVLSNGDTVFVERGDIVRTQLLPCGRCIGCRRERSRQWAVRCKHEASLHKENCFVTLTFDDEHLPYRGSLDYRSFQLFMKRLRKFSKTPVRFFMCGEYGTQTMRPHFHAILFGFDFPDKKRWQKRGKYDVFKSEILAKLWPFGLHEIGQVSFDSAQYVAAYCIKKEYGKDNDPRVIAKYGRVDPDTGEFYLLEREFGQMSLKPGIGAGWVEKYPDQMMDFDQVIMNGQPMKPPRYYDKLLKRKNRANYEERVEARIEKAQPKRADNTDARLSVKEKVTEGRIKFYKRKDSGL